jgi:hypothetical protein
MQELAEALAPARDSRDLAPAVHSLRLSGACLARRLPLEADGRRWSVEQFIPLGQALPAPEACRHAVLWTQVVIDGRLQVVQLERRSWAHATEGYRRAAQVCHANGRTDSARLLRIVSGWPREALLHTTSFWVELDSGRPRYPDCSVCGLSLRETPAREPWLARLSREGNEQRLAAQQLRAQAAALCRRAGRARGRTGTLADEIGASLVLRRFLG